MKSLILFTVTYFLLGCQSVLTQTNKQVENQNVTKAKRVQSNTNAGITASKLENTYTDRTVMPAGTSSSLKEYSPLALFKELSIDKISFNFKPQALVREDFVKIKINLTDKGSVDSIDIIASSGNKQLEKDAFQAIHKAAPLPLPVFKGKDLEKAKTLTIVFPMDLH